MFLEWAEVLSISAMRHPDRPDTSSNGEHTNLRIGRGTEVKANTSGPGKLPGYKMLFGLDHHHRGSTVCVTRLPTLNVGGLVLARRDR